MGLMLWSWLMHTLYKIKTGLPTAKTLTARCINGMTNKYIIKKLVS